MYVYIYIYKIYNMLIYIIKCIINLYKLIYIYIYIMNTVLHNYMCCTNRNT